MKRPCFVLLLLTTFFVAAPSRANPQEPLVAYTVMKRDTCASIATKLYGDSKWVDLIHANNELGPRLPHKLKPGQVLHLPPHIPQDGASPDKLQSAEILSASPDARLTFIRNSVDAYTPIKHAGERNEGLRRGHRVSTLDAASAEVTFVDDSRLQLGEHTLVVILGTNSSEAQSKGAVSDTTLVNGSLRAYLADLAGVVKKPIDLRTPAASVKLGAGESQVSVDDKRATRLAVYRGKSRLRASNKEVSVPSGFGSKAEEGKAPTPPRPLPAPPVWVTAPATFVLSMKGPPEIKGAFAPGVVIGAPAAALYHLQFARDERMNDLVLDAKVPGTVNDFTVKEVPAGNFYARVSAVDSDQFEGKPSETVKVIVGLATVTSATTGHLAAADVTPGLYCSVDGGAYLVVRAPIQFTAGQAHTLSCAPTVDGGGSVATSIPDAPVPGIRMTSKFLPMQRDKTGATQGIVFVLTDGLSVPVGGALIVPKQLPFGVTVDPVVPSGATGSYATTAHYVPGKVALPVRFLINGADEVVVMLSAEDGKLAEKASDPVKTNAAPKRVGGELALFGAGHLAGSHPSIGGGVEGGFRVLFGKVSLAVGLRGAIDQYFGDLGDQVISLGLPISLGIGGPDARFTPYIGVLPELTTHRSLTGGTLVRYGGFIGGLLRVGPNGLFIDLGYERAFNDDTLNSFFALVGYRMMRL